MVLSATAGNTKRFAPVRGKYCMGCSTFDSIAVVHVFWMCGCNAELGRECVLAFSQNSSCCGLR
jgi:hypothetical protein